MTEKYIPDSFEQLLSSDIISIPGRNCLPNPKLGRSSLTNMDHHLNARLYNVVLAFTHCWCDTLRNDYI